MSRDFRKLKTKHLNIVDAKKLLKNENIKLTEKVV